MTDVAHHDSTPPAAVPGFFARLVELLAATDRFIAWYGAHRAWPATENPRIGRCR